MEKEKGEKIKKKEREGRREKERRKEAELVFKQTPQQPHHGGMEWLLLHTFSVSPAASS